MERRPFAAMAAHMLEGGYSPVPLRPGQKRPLFEEWDRLRTASLGLREIASIARSEPSAGLGVAGGYGGLTPIDIDVEDRDIQRAIWRALPRPSVAKRGRRGCTVFYWAPDGVAATKIKQPLGDRRYATLVEVLTTGQTVLPPTIHPETRQPFKWLTQRTLFNTRVYELPTITAGDIAAMRKALEPWAPAPTAAQITGVQLDAVEVGDRRMRALAVGLLDRVSMALAGVPVNHGRNNELFRAVCTVGKFVHHGVLARSEVESKLFSACQRNGLWQDKDCGPKGCRMTFESALRRSVNDKITLPEDSESWKKKRVFASAC